MGPRWGWRSGVGVCFHALRTCALAQYQLANTDRVIWGTVTVLPTQIRTQRASQVQNLIHMLLTPNAGRGCEGLGQCHAASMWSSALTRLESNEMGLFSLTEEVKHWLIFTNYKQNKELCLRNILGQTDKAVCWNRYWPDFWMSRLLPPWLWWKFHFDYRKINKNL